MRTYRYSVSASEKKMSFPSVLALVRLSNVSSLSLSVSVRADHWPTLRSSASESAIFLSCASGYASTLE